jgi:hypothetical protein
MVGAVTRHVSLLLSDSDAAAEIAFPQCPMFVEYSQDDSPVDRVLDAFNHIPDFATRRVEVYSSCGALSMRLVCRCPPHTSSPAADLTGLCVWRAR